jgi:ABC-type uncharacterized transport system permease subunit
VTPEFANALFVLTAAAYFTASALFLAYLFGAPRSSSLVRLAPWVLGLGVVLHASQITVASEIAHVCPVAGIQFGMSVAAFLACVVYLVARRRYRIGILGAFIAPLALTALLASHFVAGGFFASSQPVKSALLPLHVITNLLGVAFFSLAFAASVVYLVQERHLKAKNIRGSFTRLPPLDQLDKTEHRFLLAGFPLLTIGVVTGTLWAKQIAEGGLAEQLRAAFAYGTWFLVAGVLILRAAAGWRGRRAAYGTIAGFALTVVVLLLYLLGAPA